MPSRQTETATSRIILNPLWGAAFLAAVGWLGLLYMLGYIHPTPPARAAFLALWGVALLGTAYPVLLALYRRFSGEPSAWTVWRQSLWLGVIGIAFAWLQMNRLFKPGWAALLVGVFGLIELILGVRGRQDGASRDDSD